MCQSKMSSFATEDQLSEANSDSDDIPEEGVRASVHDPDQPTGAMEGALADMLRRAESNGASTETMRRLTVIVSQYKDVFRLELGNDPPARVEPMVIEMIEDDAFPIRDLLTGVFVRATVPPGVQGGPVVSLPYKEAFV